ncbi:hypothetical protein B5F13_01165 [Drancourtella sp. An177]|nr:hypothetical protein B5F13_01165 [Drancourtella sp. An177]
MTNQNDRYESKISIVETEHPKDSAFFVSLKRLSGLSFYAIMRRNKRKNYGILPGKAYETD